MSVSPTGIIPEELMRPHKKGAVIEYLKQFPIPGDEKVELLVGWARMVGTKVNAAQRNTVRESGTGRIPPSA